MTTIDELLGEEYDGHPEPPRPRLTPLGVIVQTLLLTAVLAAAAWGAARLADYVIPYLLLYAGCLAAVGGWRLVVALRAPAAPPLPPPVAQPPDREAIDRPFAEARRWAERLEGARNNVERFRWTVLPAVKALADERLRLRHGITRYSHPERAAELLGPRLMTLLDAQQLQRVPTPAELSALVKELEEL